MTEKTYTVQFKPPEISTEQMTAANAEVYGDHLVFLNSNEEPVAFFLLEMIESWTVTNLSRCAPEGFSKSVESGGGSARLPTAS